MAKGKAQFFIVSEVVTGALSKEDAAQKFVELSKAEENSETPKTYKVVSGHVLDDPKVEIKVTFGSAPRAKKEPGEKKDKAPAEPTAEQQKMVLGAIPAEPVKMDVINKALGDFANTPEAKKTLDFLVREGKVAKNGQKRGTTYRNIAASA